MSKCTWRSSVVSRGGALVFGVLIACVHMMYVYCTRTQDVYAATDGNKTMKLNDVALGKVIQVGESKFVKVGTNTYLALTPAPLESEHTCDSGQLYSQNRGECVTIETTNSSDFCPISSVTGFLQDFTQSECNTLAATTVSKVGGTACLADERDGKIYAVRRYPDGQCWLAQNLVFGTCNATQFPTSNVTATRAYVGTYGGHAYWGRCLANGRTFGSKTYSTGYDGYLYDWSATMNNRTAIYKGSYSAHTYDTTSYQTMLATHDICPLGWHVPTSSDLTKINSAVNSRAGFFATTSANSWNATNKSTLAGYVSATSLTHQGMYSDWWSSSHTNSTTTYFMTASTSETSGGGTSNSYAFSVRCLLGNTP